MSILDKISNMFGSKGEEEAGAPMQADEPMATPVEPMAPVEPTTPAEPGTPEAPEVTPQPDMITPEGEAPAEAPEEEKSGEGNINLNA